MFKFGAKGEAVDRPAGDSSKLQLHLHELFEGLFKRLVKYCTGSLVTVNKDGGYAISPVTTGIDCDGTELIAYLAVIDWFIEPEKHFPATEASPPSAGDSRSQASLSSPALPRLKTSMSMNFRSETSLISKPISDILADFECPLCLKKYLQDTRKVLIDKLNIYVNDQLAWLESLKRQYLGTKKSIIFPPFEKFPSFIDQLSDMTGGLVSVLCC